VVVAAAKPVPPPQLTIFEDPMLPEMKLADVEQPLLTREVTAGGTSIYGLARRSK